VCQGAPASHAGVRPDDLKRLVAVLDEQVKRGFTVDPKGARKPFAWKSASNVWSTVRALFRDAQRAKRVDLCVRDDNPAAGLTGPDTGAHKAKAYLWPSEFAALVSCARVPLRWRRLFALAVYTYARAGELTALEWGDVDLEHGTLHIHRSTDRAREHAKATKTDTARRVPIGRALLPL
jgi:integrase